MKARKLLDLLHERSSQGLRLGGGTHFAPKLAPDTVEGPLTSHGGGGGGGEASRGGGGGNDPFLRGYLRAALWSSTDQSDESGGEPMDNNYSDGDISGESKMKAMADCKRFQQENAQSLSTYYQHIPRHPDASTPQDSAGHDFWLTRCGHGTGFWDRHYGLPDEMETACEALTKACEAFGNVDLIVGDDGELHFEP